MSASLIGRTLAHYRMRGQLGAGGMGEVYRAPDTGSARCRDQGPAGGLRDDPERLARFEREAQLLASLNHPTSPIYGFERSARRRGRTRS